jgi:uncharacterized protein (TIGR03437 family)
MVSALPLAALADTTLNLDNGATGSSGGDILFNPGTGISPQGKAQLDDFGSSGMVEWAYFPLSQLANLNYSTSPIGPGSLVVDEMFVVHTNGGNYGVTLAIAASGSSITLQYVTYNASGTKIQGGTVTLGGTGAPVVTMVQNNYSYIVPNAPNYGIAPGTLFIVEGLALAAPGSQAVLQNPANPLPLTLNGSSVAVTVNGTTAHPAFYYAIPTQLGVVLPSSTPVGTGTITVSYGNQTSAPAPIVVVAHAFGFDFYGGALAAATDSADGHLITATNSAKPGETISLWGSGLGADTNNDDMSPPTHFDNLGGITALYFGSVQVPVLYQGRSSYQGVDQINVTVPSNAPTGCAVSVSAVSGTGGTAMAGNIAMLPISTDGGACVDPIAFVDPVQVAALAGKTTVRFGAIAVLRGVIPGAASTVASAAFFGINGAALAGYESSFQPSLGSCWVTQASWTVPAAPSLLTGLNAGSLSVSGPNGTQALAPSSLTPGDYGAALSPAGFLPPSGTVFTFTGSGGSDVGAFTASLSFPTPLVWTNANTDATVTRAQGLTVNWTGGSGFAEITGTSSSTASGFTGSFVCNVPVGPGTFTVPPSVLLALPPGTGTVILFSNGNPVSFTPPSGLDFAYAMAGAETTITAAFK